MRSERGGEGEMGSDAPCNLGLAGTIRRGQYGPTGKKDGHGHLFVEGKGDLWNS